MVALPKQRDYVYLNDKTKILLESEVSAGGEGVIFNSSDGRVCKIYHQNHLTSDKIAKLELMVNKSVNIDGVCWPKAILYNKNNTFVGYLMDKAQGIPMQYAIFTKPALRANFPKWNRGNLVQLAITILKKFIKLHEKKILLGDINPFNILIQSDHHVYFVDTDSYQIEKFPCPVGTINFTPPELQKKDYRKILRTIEHENFAVATLLFMILLPGKPPYSQAGGGTPGENIKNMNFPYAFRERENDPNLPGGAWRYIWSHLTYKIKEAFYNTFRENQRLSSQEWLDLMETYLHNIKEGHLSDELFPTGIKLKDPVDVICGICGKKDRTNKQHWEEELKPKGKQYWCLECKDIRDLEKEIKIRQEQETKRRSIVNNKLNRSSKQPSYSLPITPSNVYHNNKQKRIKQPIYSGQQQNINQKSSRSPGCFIIIALIIIWLVASAVAAYTR